MEINGSRDQNASVDSDHHHHHHITRNSTGKPMQLNGSRSNSPSPCGSNRRRHSSVIPALPKTNPNSVVPSPNYLRASTGSCHDFCKFGRKKSFEESKPWRVVRKQSDSSSVVASTPNVEMFLQNQADPLKNDVLPGKVDKDDVPEKEKSCEKKIKLSLNRKQQPTVVAKPKPVVAVISGEMGASIKKDSKIMVSKPRISKPVVNKNTDRVEKKVVLDQPADIRKTSNGKPIIKIGKSLDISTKTEKSSFPAAATSKKEKPSSLPPAASQPIKSVSTNRSVKTNNSPQQPPIIKKRSNNENSLKKTVIKQIVDADIIPAVESTENGDRNHEESNNENYLEKTVDSDNIPAVESTENGDRIQEESSNEMEIVFESENLSVESNENGDNTEVEESSEDDDEEETEEDEEDSISESSSEEEEEEEDGFSRGNRPKTLAEDNNGSEGVKLKFRRGRVIDIQSEENGSPRRLRFRRRRVESPKEGRSYTKRQNFRKKATIISDNNNDNPDSEIIMLRHQDIEEKKDAQGLLNNVIEETANKLAEVRKSKVKALVGAFETVISLQENNTSNSKQSSLQTIFS